MGYVIIGIICFMLGGVAGIIALVMCAVSKAADTQHDIDDSCHGCFGASFGDCDTCPKKGGEVSETHTMGNSPKCYECKFYIEKEDVRTKQPVGYCSCKQHLRLGINGKIRNNPPEFERVASNGCCKFWIDAESGHTKFEVLTGYKEPYDGTKIDFSENKKGGDSDVQE